MIQNHNSINGQTVILGAFLQSNVQALIYWAMEKKRRGVEIVASDWTTAQMAESIQRVNSDVMEKEVEFLGKLDIGVKWAVWDTKWQNYLRSLQGASGIPLGYLVRHDMPATWDSATNAANEHDRLKYQALMTGPPYETDRMTVYR